MVPGCAEDLVDWTEGPLQHHCTVSQGEIAVVAERLRAFARERDWDRFHTPKNLAASVAIEAAELQEVFQWLSDEESSGLSATQLAAARTELADVAIYVIRLADVLKVDLIEAIEQKILENGRRYPVAQVRGRAEKRP